MIFKAEMIKEKRGSNQKMLVLVPIFFILFCFLFTLLMGTSQAGKSNLIATAFNWYPTMILPVVVSLLVTNSLKKEQKQNRWLYQIQQISSKKVILAKFSLVALELFSIVSLSTVLLEISNAGFFHDTIAQEALLKATLLLFIGSLPTLAFDFLLSRWNKTWLPILANLSLGTAASALIAVEPYWYWFPWCYSLRMLAPTLGLHPNGTFLSPDSSLWDQKVIGFGCLLSFFVAGLFLIIALFFKRGAEND